ncbi:MAG TPA: glycosyltransferase family 39 protein, partial [Opitutaceae bacterium]|nr:glycosyltransferase family 39 protein [Opitutaceae bacterium]
MTWLLAFGSAWLIGLLGIAAAWPRHRRLRDSLSLILPLGLGLGLAATSAAYFFCAAFAPAPLAVSSVLEILVAIALVVVIRRRRRVSAQADGSFSGLSWASCLAATLLVQAAVAAVVVALRGFAASPFGLWDGWAIWNMHARFVASGNPGIGALARSPELIWTHPDYPMLIPASVALAWAICGAEIPLVPGLVSLLFAAATVCLLVGAVSRLRNALVGCVAGLVLLGTPFFLSQATAQYADIPLGFFILASCAALVISAQEGRGFLFLAGAAAGAAAWTKNEGMLFAMVAAACVAVSGAPARRRERLPVFLGGLFLALVPVVLFKGLVAPSNDVVSMSVASRLGQVADGSRHHKILSALMTELGRFGEWGSCPYIGLAATLLLSGRPRIGRPEKTVVCMLVLTLAGYYFIYLVTPRDLSWQLTFSLNRLLLQLWPSAIFLWALCLGFESAPKPAVGRRTLAVFVAANLVLGCLVLSALGRQLAPDELMEGKVDGSSVAVGLGQGWYGKEGGPGETWSWSKGRSELRIFVEGDTPGTSALEFRVRSLGTRVVTARFFGGIVWKGQVAEGYQEVEIPGLRLHRGINTIE